MSSRCSPSLLVSIHLLLSLPRILIPSYTISSPFERTMATEKRPVKEILQEAETLSATDPRKAATLYQEILSEYHRTL